MKNYTARTVAFTFCITIFLPFLSHACYSPRTLDTKARRINQRQGCSLDAKKALVTAYKQTVSNNDKLPKLDTVNAVFQAVIHKNRQFKENDKKIISDAIEKFHAVNGFDQVFSRLIHGIASKNKSNFNGALAELVVALEKEKIDEKVLAFNVEVEDAVGNTLTDIDVVVEDAWGIKHAVEVKSRKQSSTKKRINKHQLDRQKKFAQTYGWKHELLVTLHQ